MLSRCLTIVLMSCLSVLFACEGPERAQTPTQGTPRPAQMPSYAQLVERFNVNADRFERLWARAHVEVTWYDEDGEEHQEVGDDSRLIMVMPDNLALTLGKLGQNAAWIGSNSDAYWLFELRADPKTLTFGRYRYVGMPCSQQLPTPVHPLHLPRMLGVVPIEAYPPEGSPPVKWVEGAYVIEPPQTATRYTLDPQTALPTRVDLLDARGEAAVTAMLSERRGVQTQGVNPSFWPTVPSHIVVQLADEQHEAVIDLSEPSDGRSNNRIREDRVFDLDRLRRAFKPERVVDLDARCIEQLGVAK